MLDDDDSDPLDDILLSDEDNYKTNKQPLFVKNLESSDVSKADGKKKIFGELFGETKEQSIAPEVAEKKSSSDWLNLKDKPTENQADLKLDNVTVNTGGNSNKKVTFETKKSNWLGLLEDLTDVKFTDVPKDEFGNADKKTLKIETPVERRKSDIPTITSSTQRMFKKESHHSKSLEIDLDTELNSSDFIINPKPQITDRKLSEIDSEPKLKIPFEESRYNVSKESDLDAVKERAYVPSSTGGGRRYGFGKNKENISRVSVVEPKLATIDPVQTERKKSAENLPSWLGGGPTLETKKEFNFEISKETIGNDNDENNHEEIKTTGDIRDIPNNVNVLANKIDNSEKDSGLNDVSELKRKQTELFSIVKNQVDLYSKHEKEIKQAVLELIGKQHNNINSLVQMVVSPTFDVTKSKFQMEDVDEKDKFEHSAHRLNVRIKELELEKCALEAQLEFMQRRNELQLTSLEEAYNQKLDLLSEHEKRLKQEISAIEDDYKNKLLQQKRIECELVQSYKDRIEYLQDERTADLKKIEELNGFIRNNQIERTQFSKGSGRTGLSDAVELSVREESVLKKENELMEFQDELNRQKMVLDSKKSTLEEKMEEFELKSAKEKMNIELRKKELNRTESNLLQKAEMWQYEKDREVEYLTKYKQEIEVAKQDLLKKERDIARQQFELAADKSRLEAFTQLEGINPNRMTDAIQSRAEVQAAIEEARQLKSVLDEQQKQINAEGKKLKQERWALQEAEEHLAMKMKHIERLVAKSNEKYEEGMRSLRKSKKIEYNVNEKLNDIADKLSELQVKENNLLMEKMAICKEREMLNKCKMEMDGRRQFSFNAPEFVSWANPFYVSNKDVIDPRYLILKMKAEQNNHVSVTDITNEL